MVSTSSTVMIELTITFCKMIDAIRIGSNLKIVPKQYISFSNINASEL